MRAREFIVEYKEYPTREYEGVTFTMKERDGQLIVKPLNDYGISMGHVVFNMDGKLLDPQDLVIADKYQGQGIARVMYDYIKSLGFTIERSWDQTDAGAGFWNKHRGEDVRIWETSTPANVIPAEQVWDYVGGIHPADQQGGGFLKSLIMLNPEYELKRVPLSSLHIPNEEDEGNDPYNRAMFVDVDHAREYSQYQVDKKPLVVDSQGHILDGSHRAWAASELLGRKDIMAYVPVKQDVTEGRGIKQEIEEFLDSLSPEDVGVEQFGNYRVHYEGFTDDCKSSGDYRRNPNKVYKQVYQDFIDREGGRKPVKSSMVGDEEYPILYSVFKVPQSKTIDTPEKAYSIAYKKKQPWPRGSREEKLIRSNWQLSGLYDQYVLKQGVAEGSLNEYRDRMYQYIKSIVPGFPDYIVKDWLYANFARGATQGPNWSFDTIGKDIPNILKDMGLSIDTKWQLVPNMKFTMDMWEPKTLKRLQARAGGSSKTTDPDVHIPTRDAERHATQAKLAQQQGGVRKEPVIIIKTAQGYELLEGWHRTIQHFAMYPQGYTGPAYVAVAQGQQGVAEAVHPDVVSKNYFNDPTENVRMGDFEFNARTFTGGLGTPNARGLQIRAYDPKLPKGSGSIGSADFIVKSDKKGNQWLESDDTEVNDEYRGKGVAAMMYAFAKSLGNDIERSPYQSKAGSTMWNKWGNDAKHLVGEEGLAETFDQPYPLEWERDKRSKFIRTTAISRTDDGGQIEIIFDESKEGVCSIRFLRNEFMGITGEGDALKVFATVLNSIKHYLSKISKPKKIYFSAEKDVLPGEKELSRTSLYTRMVNRFAHQFGYSTQVNDRDSFTAFVLTKNDGKQGVAEEQLDELFQQGKQNWTWKIKADTEAIAKFSVGDRDYMWMAYSHFRDDKPNKWEIQFRALRKSTDPEKLELYGKTGTGNSAQVMSTAVDITREFLQYYGDSVQQLSFDAKEDSRIQLYRRMVQRLLPNWEADEEYSREYGLRFTLNRPKQM